VGGNTQFLLNIPPDRRGLIHGNDIARLKELGDFLRRAFGNNLAQGAKASASSARANNYDAGRAADGNHETYWTADDWNEKPIIEFDLGEEKTFNCAVLQEYIKAGQRVEEFSLESWDGYGWNQILRSTTIGYKRILFFNRVKAQKVRVCFIQTRLSPTLSEFGLYQANY
jgi:alpha-L-fucosidase